MTELNEEGIPGPGGRPWGDTTIRGQVDRGTGLLNNTLYIGRMEWNRCSYVKNPQTGKKVARVNPMRPPPGTRVSGASGGSHAVWPKSSDWRELSRWRIRRARSSQVTIRGISRRSSPSCRAESTRTCVEKPRKPYDRCMTGQASA